MTSFRTEPGFVKDLRNQLPTALFRANFPKSFHNGGFYMDDDTLLRLVSIPEPANLEVHEHLSLKDVKKTPWTPNGVKRVGDIFFTNNSYLVPFVTWAAQKSRVHVHGADLEFPNLTACKGLSWELTPHMTIAGIYQPGECDILPIIANMRSFDHVVFHAGNFCYVHNDAINHHVISGADVTWLLDKRLDVNPTTVPVWCDGTIVVKDVRDIKDLNVDEAPYKSTKSCIISRKFAEKIVTHGMPLEAWRKRRVHLDNVLRIRFERNLCELTSLPNVHIEYLLI